MITIVTSGNPQTYILPAILSCWVCISVFEEQLILCRPPASESDDSIINEDVRRLVMESAVGFVGIGSLPVRIARTP